MKSCPVCGGVPRVEFAPDGHCVIACDLCLCTDKPTVVSVRVDGDTDGGDSYSFAANAWNGLHLNPETH